MASEEIRQRSDILGTLVVTRDTGKKLGVVSQLWVDIDQREVVALSLRPNLLYGTPQPMFLSSIRQIGDVILVDDENVIEDIDVESYSNLINCEVITETGELLGKVRGFKFDVDSGGLTALTIASIGLPLIPDQVVSTYELPVDEIVSSGPDRLIVFEGAEERLVQLSVGVLERLGIGRAPWERDDEIDYVTPVRADNQLPTGLRTPISTPIRQKEPAVQETWDDDNWGEPEPKQLRQQQRRAEPLYYGDEEEDNWSEASGRDQYDDRYPEKYEKYPEPKAYQEAYEDLEDDAWADQEQKTYNPPRVNIPEKQKAPEYEEEGY
ncbi:PRC-barrel domain-containing protein [Kovacikia minuta CCNUW1]|uniref:PRC-barrel domain-containing protein n=1 Tax=Kovacikia minuta TaxID=2931930 RepID=UPI001CCC02D0|nr:PRC-barrel domain-containing protein [Kovacikia minuta]UBF27312.1 PRC-barrel domain-containing protein [Kovacikia minuta CCNUW1]